MNPAILPASAWRVPPLFPVLGANDVHVWRAHLCQTRECVRGLRIYLSADEEERASRFYFDRDRERFVVARGVLRVILSRYLRRNPADLRFDYNTYGKPRLIQNGQEPPVCFNLSHSEDLALYAVTRGRHVGVDVEYLRADFANEQVARRFFSPREVATLCVQPRHLQTETFFRCWTRKEAYIKARGKGLSLPLDQFDVSLAPGDPAALLSCKEGPEETARWSMRELDPDPAYAAALVVEGRGWHLQRWDWVPVVPFLGR